MHWTWVDVAIYVLALLVLVLAGVWFYRRIRGFMKAVGNASARVSDASNGLNAEQAKSASRR